MSSVEQGLFIVVEGFDGVGKSTISKWLADTNGYVYKKSPGSKFAANRTHFDDSTITTHERFAYYLGDCIRLSIEIDKLTKQGVSIVLDRYYLSTICYHLIFEKEYLNQFLNLTRHLKKPDLVFLLKSPYSSIYERIMLRPNNEEDIKYLKEEYYSEIYKTFDLIIESQLLNSAKIDTEGPISLVQAKLSTELYKYKKAPIQ